MRHRREPFYKMCHKNSKIPNIIYFTCLIASKMHQFDIRHHQKGRILAKEAFVRFLFCFYLPNMSTPDTNILSPS